MGLNYICHWGRFDWEPFEVLDIWHLILVYSGMNGAMAVLNIHFGLNTCPFTNSKNTIQIQQSTHPCDYPTSATIETPTRLTAVTDCCSSVPPSPSPWLSTMDIFFSQFTFNQNRCLHRWYCVSLPRNYDPATFGCMLWLSLQITTKNGSYIYDYGSMKFRWPPETVICNTVSQRQTWNEHDLYFAPHVVAVGTTC